MTHINPFGQDDPKLTGGPYSLVRNIDSLLVTFSSLNPVQAFGCIC